MSKIYEALLRAEQDRAEETSDLAGTAVGVAVAEPRQPARSTRIEYVAPTSGFATPMDPAASSKYSVSTPVENFSLDQQTSLRHRRDETAAQGPQDTAAQVSVWHPDTAKLPALESRGSQVEQFRSLRSKLFEFRDLNKLKSVLVSSGLPAEGKSFVATNLAITFARHKSARVLLIDGDLRRSSQHKALGSPNEPGLAEYLAGKVALEEILHRGTSDREGTPLPTGLSTLSFIPAGEAGDRAADLSGSPRFAELMEAVSPHFDWIVLDSSPVNLVTDAVNLARSCRRCAVDRACWSHPVRVRAARSGGAEVVQDAGHGLERGGRPAHGGWLLRL